MTNLYHILFLLFLGLYSSLTAQKIDFPIFHEKPQRGAYASFEEFIQNKPSIIDSFYLKSKPRKHKGWEDTQSHTPHYQTDDKKIKKIWGFSDGSNTYISFQGEYFKINISEKSLSYYAYPLSDEGLATASAVGGLIGAAIYMSTTSNNLYEPTLFWINPFNGTLKLIESNEPEKVLDNIKGKFLIYRTNKKQSKEPIDLTINDTIQFTLIQNSYKKVFFPLSSDKIKVCLTNDTATCLSLLMDTDEYIYIESTKEKDLPPRLNKVTSEKGAFHYKQVKTFQEIRERKENKKK